MYYIDNINKNINIQNENIPIDNTDIENFKKNIEDKSHPFLDFSLLDKTCIKYKINLTLIHYTNDKIQIQINENNRSNNKSYVIFLKDNHFEPVSDNDGNFEIDINFLKKLQKQQNETQTQKGGKKTRNKKSKTKSKKTKKHRYYPFEDL